MSTRLRWQIALPLIGLSGLIFAAALLGTINLWYIESPAERTLRVAMCLVTTATVVVAVTIGVRPAEDVPWLRIALVFVGIGLACAITAVHYQVP